MNRAGFSAALVAICLLGSALGEWARLKDGRVVKVQGKRNAQIAIVQSDGTRGIIDREQVDGYLQSNAAIRIVDDVMEKIGKPEQHDFVRSKLKQIGMAAVPQLLVHLRSRNLDTRRAALAALQMAWSHEAQEPVSALLTDADDYIRRMALHLVQRQFPAEERLRVLAPVAEASADPQLAGPALAAVLGKSPDPEKMPRALENRALWDALHPLLPRYQGKPSVAAARRLLREGSDAIKASALVALVYQMDDHADTRTAIALLLRHSAAELRELAAEYFRWHGTVAEVPSLETQARRESDPYTLAAMRAAIDAILRRSTVFAEKGKPIDPTWPADLGEAYAEGARALRSSPDAGTRRAVLELLTLAPFEPVFHYGESWKLRPDPRHLSRLDLVSLAFACPTRREREARERAAFGSGAGRLEIPVAQSLAPPIRKYFDAKRESFGVLIGSGDHPFANSHHVGDDVSFGEQQRTVVAIGDGLVRIAQPGMRSWGGLVVIEHQSPDGTFFCSLYGHLGPLITVLPGDRVRRGEKLGTLGRDYAFATGGYRTHLHFGIHDGDFANGGRPWVGGYLAPDRYADGKTNRWVDPQPFLRKRMAQPPSPADVESD